MKLTTLFSSYSQYKSGEYPFKDIDLVTNNSKEVTSHSVFIAIKGEKFDGHNFLEEVCKKEPAAVVVSDEANIPKTFKGAILKVKDTRPALGFIASKYYDFPADHLFCVGITGTNGKTSISYLVEKIFSDFNWATGVMGTVDHHIKNHKWKTQLTTPDGLMLNKRLREMRALGAEAAVFEISSHAIVQKRAHNINLDVAVFTNLTQDHLDYHKNMNEYFKAKKKLFTEVLPDSNKKNKYMVINNDCPYGKKIEELGAVKKVTYGKENADITFDVLKQDLSGSVFKINTPRGNKEVHIPQPGVYNIYNAVAAIGVGLCADISLDSCCESLRDFTGVPGRLQGVPNSKGLNVFVDYAHTDHALESVLSTLNIIKGDSDIICVFGCGGDRDKEKRPKMFLAASTGAQKVIVTSDNPRTEDPQKIIDDILGGEKLSDKHIQEIDRKKAIEKAIRIAKKNDIILIAGKGHEDYQIIGDKYLVFDDVEVAKSTLEAL